MMTSLRLDLLRQNQVKTEIQTQKKKMKKQDNIQRRIINPDAETCWLNSCLQLVLTALDLKREAGPDVFNLFKIQTLNETECASCGHTSRQEDNGNERTFITLTCTSENVNMKDYVEEQMNGFNVVEDWRDEDSCGDQTRGRSRTRISNIEDIQYVIFVLEKLIRIDQGLHIMKTTVNVNQDEEVNLMDMDGKVGKFEAMAIIHHSGNVIGQTTQGHYRADVKNKETLN